MSVLAALGAATSLYASSMAIPPVNPPLYETRRDVLLNEVPYPYQRSRVVTKYAPASPYFDIDASGPVLTRTPAYRRWYREPGPAYYGVAGVDSLGIVTCCEQLGHTAARPSVPSDVRSR